MAKVRHLLIGLASGSALYSGMVSALGLGDITLHSHLSQPLSAEIKLLNAGDLSAADLRVRLAPADVYARAGVERLMFLNDLRFTPVFKGENSVIRVVSNSPVREPYLNFIVEVERPSGQLYREYTLLLDPPGMSAYQSVSAVQSVVAAQAAPARQPRIAPPPAVMPEATQGKGYSVVSGDSLWKIAKRFTPAGTSIDALMNDIYALNPQAFVGGDMNRLKAGVQLRLPDRADSPAANAVVAEAVPAAPAQSSVTDAAVAQPRREESVENAPQPLATLEPEATVQPQQLAQVEQALTAQTEQTQQLQENLQALSAQVQQLQEQMIAREQQIALLQAELAEQQAARAAQPAAPMQPVPNVTETGSSSSWWTGVSGLLALLLAGVLALLWRKNKSPKSAVENVQATPVAPSKPAAITPAYVRSTQSAAVPQAATPEPDALQSANVYMAYGHYKEAAETLRKAWAADPQKGDVGFRYLEALAMLGDVQGYLQLEPQVRATGFNPVRLDELKSKHATLFIEQPTESLADAVLNEAEVAPKTDETAPLNLDDFTLSADWDAVNPFAPTAPSKEEPVQETAEIFDLADSRDARSPFAQTMLVEETSHGNWQDELSAELLELDLNLQDEHFNSEAELKDNLTKLNIAQAFIDQGNYSGACEVLNEVILEGDENQQQEARELLARIA